MSLLLFFSLFASAAWKPVATPRGFQCWPEMPEANAVVKTWSNGHDTFVICGYGKLPAGLEYRLDSLFEVQATLAGKKIRIAREAEVGVKPVEIHIHGDAITLITYLYDKQPYYERTIECGTGGCRLSAPKCLLQADTKAAKEAEALDKRLSALTGEKRLKLWVSYFEMGANTKLGRSIVIAAMLGNATARKVVESSVGADAGAGESQSLYKDDIQAAVKFCPNRP